MTPRNSTRFATGSRPTWAEVSVDALRHNFQTVTAHLKPGVEICAVVKADSYGHGTVECSRAFEDIGTKWLGVTGVEEGRHLRDHGIRSRILAMTGFWRGEEAAAIAYDLAPAVWDFWHIEALQRACELRNGRVYVHLKLNTGMTRLGLDVAYLKEFLARLAKCNRVHLEGVFTHLASSEVVGDQSVTKQIAEFDKAMAVVRGAGFTPRFEHIANSAAVITHPESQRNMVRTGLALYGYFLPFVTGEAAPAAVPDQLNLRPALSWKTRIISLRRVPAGTACGYNGRFVTRRESLIAAVPVGYADGLVRHLSNRGRMIVRDTYVRVAGNIAMDLTLLDVTDARGVEVGDEVIIIGASENCAIDAWEHARLAHTVPYEILCNIHRRVKRVYEE